MTPLDIITWVGAVALAVIMVALAVAVVAEVIKAIRKGQR